MSRGYLMGRKANHRLKKEVATKPLSIHQEMKAIVNGCEEASPTSGSFYIPCNAPAAKNIYSKVDNKIYRMCKACAYHAVKNRGMIDKGSYIMNAKALGKAPSILDKAFRKGLGEKTKVVTPKDLKGGLAGKKAAKIIDDGIDTSDFEQEEASKDQLQQIKEAAMKAVALEKQIEDLNAAIATLAADRDTLLNKSLPAMLDSANMDKFRLGDGSEIEIKDVVSGTLPSADKKPKEREKALAWVDKNGGSGLIKTTYKTEFGKGQEKEAAAFEKLITKAKFAAKKDTGIHPQTLCAFVRELLEDGKKVPIETLGIYVGRHAKIKLSTDAQKKAEAERVKPKRSK